MAQVSGSASMPVSVVRFMVPAGFAAGVVAVAGFPRLHPGASLALLGATLGCCLCCRLRAVAALLAGMAWASAIAQSGLDHRLSGCMEGTIVALTGVVTGLPRQRGDRTQFDVEPTRIAPWPRCAGAMPRRIRLGWDAAPKVEAGEVWRMWVRLRSIRGYQNPGGFDYEGWAFANGIDAAGTVRLGERAAAAPIGIDAWRARLRELIVSLPLEQPGIVLALVSGDASLLGDSDWRLARRTGTVHLLVISGLHLGIVAAVGALLGRSAARLLPGLLERGVAAHLALAGGFVLATLYALLAGFGVPVRRAWSMSVLVLLFASWARKPNLPLLFAATLAMVLLVEPLAPLAAGFWLSFGAVGVLLGHFAPRLGRRSLLADLLRAQAVLACAMVPLLAATIGQFAWTAPVANLLAVPWVSLLLVPLDLLAAAMLLVHEATAAWLFGVVDELADLLVRYLEWLASFDAEVWISGPRWPAIGIAAGAAVLWLLPLSRPQRLVLVPCLLLPMLVRHVDLPSGEFRTTVLDVGQGLAVLVDTAQHHLLYDAGPRYPSGHDLGKVVVLPSLERFGVARLDRVILSHADMDHVGGFGKVAHGIEVRSLSGGEALAGYPMLRLCRAGERWQWDGVRFDILHPDGVEGQPDNDRSCVLLIDNGRRRALLPGDVSSAAEAVLLARGPLPRVDVLVVAHHGSRGSSSPALLAQLKPRFALVSAGYRNHFGHPHAEVIERLAAVGARIADTACSGALEWHSDQSSRLQRWRERGIVYWRVGAAAGCGFSMNNTGTRQTKNTTATARNESRKASMLPWP